MHGNGVGSVEGENVGFTEGDWVEIFVGIGVGASVGIAVGKGVGLPDGEGVGSSDGPGVGSNVGSLVSHEMDTVKCANVHWWHPIGKCNLRRLPLPSVHKMPFIMRGRGISSEHCGSQSIGIRIVFLLLFISMIEPRFFIRQLARIHRPSLMEWGVLHRIMELE